MASPVFKIFKAERVTTVLRSPYATSGCLDAISWQTAKLRLRSLLTSIQRDVGTLLKVGLGSWISCQDTFTYLLSFWCFFFIFHPTDFWFIDLGCWIADSLGKSSSFSHCHHHLPYCHLYHRGGQQCCHNDNLLPILAPLVCAISIYVEYYIYITFLGCSHHKWSLLGWSNWSQPSVHADSHGTMCVLFIPASGF